MTTEERTGGGGPSTYSVPGGQSPSVAIVSELEALTGRDALALEPLSNSIDPGALDRLLGDRRDVSVSFRHAGHRIVVCATDGELTVAID